ncbi:McrBC 5-methylcytosine restriction system component [Yoonia rosea]|uniref:McrBC 5-methylcytosine restriction system component n=1 Tax=Yoonia rosea TaxID=287098 RepID=A0A1R3WWM3_9RHOB|nr:hypothetical protein [Yoonia rosea]SIT82465.1 McrBC 5-methylcytosine restriction system component [Yoonia rosea]
MAVQIPVLNFFHMFVYAWGEFRPGSLKTLQASDIEAPVDFLASMLCEATQEILRESLAKKHGFRTERMHGVRGKIDVTRSTLLPDFRAGMLICHYPSMEVDGIENQIIKATFKALVSNRSIDQGIREQAAKIFKMLKVVADVPLSKRRFAAINLDRSMRRYRFPLALCELLFDQMYVSDGKGLRWFSDYINDELAMRRLFEAFVRNFLKAKLGSRYSIASKRFAPVGLEVLPRLRSLIPSMQTDVSVFGDHCVLIIDTKFSGSIFQKRFGSKRIRSDHFYQIQAYVSHQSTLSSDLSVSGMLLYPRIDEDLRLDFSTLGHHFSVCTINLNKKWNEIEGELLLLVNGRMNRSQANIICE